MRKGFKLRNQPPQDAEKTRIYSLEPPGRTQPPRNTLVYVTEGKQTHFPCFKALRLGQFVAEANRLSANILESPQT